jgi:hypothetical protein
MRACFEDYFSLPVSSTTAHYFTLVLLELHFEELVFSCGVHVIDAIFKLTDLGFEGLFLALGFLK